MQTRREFIKGLIVSVGGASALSACGGLATLASSGSFIRLANGRGEQAK